MCTRDEVMSGMGEGGEGEGLAASLTTLAETRERAAVLIPSLGSEQAEVAAVMGELLLQADLVAVGAREAVEEVEGQLEVADKQLRSTRAFLEEQAAEREQEREEWEKRLSSYKGRRESSLKRSEEWTQEVEEEEEEEGGLDAGEEKQKRREAERELRAAVDKIYELRDIIRTLETQMEAKVAAQVQQQETVAELKVALEEAVVGHTMVHQELELLRSSSSDVEFVEHIRALEEQLGLKTAEVTKQRVAAAQVRSNNLFLKRRSYLLNALQSCSTHKHILSTTNRLRQ